MFQEKYTTGHNWFRKYSLFSVKLLIQALRLDTVVILSMPRIPPQSWRFTRRSQIPHHPG
uniref:Uncharacterized protein n=1 Tax=Anguilla anguilla TaxID=7936 RepID=A0A0E9RBR0_ANGAN